MEYVRESVRDNVYGVCGGSRLNLFSLLRENRQVVAKPSKINRPDNKGTNAIKERAGIKGRNA